MRGISMVEFNDVELGVIREILFGHAGAPNVIDVGALAHRFHVVGHVLYGEAGADARYAFVQKLQGVDRRPPAPAPALAPTSDTAAAAAQVVVQEIREYCEYMFSPQWLADPQNRSIFAAHVYGIIRDGAATASSEAHDVAVAPAPLSFKCAGYDWHFKMTDEVARLRAENAALTEKARDAIAEADIAETAHKQACDVIAPLEKALSEKEAELVTLRADNTRISGEMERTSATLGALSNSYGKLKAENAALIDTVTALTGERDRLRANYGSAVSRAATATHEIEALVAVTKERIKELNEWRSNARADETGHLKNCSKIDGTWRCATRCAVFRATMAEAEAAEMKKARDTLYVERNEIEKQWRGQAVELRDTLQLLREARTHVAYDSTLMQRIAIAAQELLPRIDKTLSVERDAFYTEKVGTAELRNHPTVVIERGVDGKITKVEDIPGSNYTPSLTPQPALKPVVPPAPGTIFKHYKTGNTYRKLFETHGVNSGVGPVLDPGEHKPFLVGTCTTDGLDDQIGVEFYMDQDAVICFRSANPPPNPPPGALYFGFWFRYEGVAYIALDGDSAGRIFFRAKAEFEATVDVNNPNAGVPDRMPRFQELQGVDAKADCYVLCIGCGEPLGEHGQGDGSSCPRGDGVTAKWLYREWKKIERELAAARAENAALTEKLTEEIANFGQTRDVLSEQRESCEAELAALRANKP